MGAASQIKDLLSDLPIDDTWLLIGLSVLAVAALLHLHNMWKQARFGFEPGTNRPNVYPAQRYLNAWESAADEAGLETMPTDGELIAPRMTGRLRGLPVDVQMHLERSGRRSPNPEALNPATVRCPITAHIQLPAPWCDATVHRFTRPEAFEKGDTDNITFGKAVPSNWVQYVQMNRQARRALSTLLNDFETLKLIDGTLTVVDRVHPSRNTGRWAASFGEPIDRLRTDATAFADGGLMLAIEPPDSGQNALIRVEPSTDLERSQCRVAVEIDGKSLPDEDQLRSQLHRIGVAVRNLDMERARLQMEGTADRSGSLVGSLIEVLTSNVDDDGPTSHR